jgi:integrase
MPASLCLFRRSNGFYYIYYVKDGRRRWKSTGCRSKPDAIRVVSNIDELLKTKPIHVRFSGFIVDFLAYARATLRPKTVELYLRAFKHIQPLVGDAELASLTSQHLDTYKVRRLGSVSAISVNMEIRALKAALATAVRWKLIPSNPFQGVQSVKVPATIPAFFTKEDFAKLLAVMRETWIRELVVLAASTGMRQGEIRNLRWDDVDLQRRVIHIESGPQFHTKAGKNRVVPMNDVVTNILNCRVCRNPSQYVFTFRGRQIERGYLTHIFKRYVRAAGLDERYHFHTLRHYAELGIRDTQASVGWAIRVCRNSSFNG